MSVESVQWLLKTGIKFSDLPELFQDIEKHRERLSTFEPTFERIHKTTFIVSTEKKTIVERSKDDQRFVEAELINQKKVKLELNMTGDAPDTFLALLSLKDSDDVHFRILLFHSDTPSHRQLFNGPKAMLDIFVLPLNLNELERQLKIAQLIVKEKEISFDADSTFLDTSPEIRPKIRQNERSQIFSFVPNGLINKAVKLKRSIRNVMKHIVCRHEEITFTIASWSLLLSSRSYAKSFLLVCSVWLFVRVLQLILLDLTYDEKTNEKFEALFLSPISSHFSWFDYILLFRLIRLTSSLITVYSFFVNTKVASYLYTTTVEVSLAYLCPTTLYRSFGATAVLRVQRREREETTDKESVPHTNMQYL
ncbi:hypothetical protein DdX_07049 [Ditylenchus destructor]|uniref:Uncharacterized protein n=1 Tax=Ditylenchus destructor TaxID=166010 RepID=A0AAD4NAF1_9BILA|nr:hypothetical protein DdX_07049 [Ditylenchus destructor]